MIRRSPASPWMIAQAGQCLQVPVLCGRLPGKANGLSRTVKLPPPQKKKNSTDSVSTDRLFSVFVKYYYTTADGSGTIDREELALLLRELGISVNDAMTREVLPRLDLDCSGDIRRDELALWVEKASEPPRQNNDIKK